MRILTLPLKRTIERKCKLNAPEDTGNLRHNAIKGSFWSDPNRFRITYSVADADYVVYLEEAMFAGNSRTKENKHRRFITMTYLELANMLESYFNEGGKRPSARNFSNSELQGTYRRVMRHQASLDRNRLQREVN